MRSRTLSLVALLFTLVVGAAVGFTGGHASCDGAGGTTIIKRQDRLEATP